MTTRLKKEYCGKVIESPALQGLIAEATGRSFTTVIRWAEESHRNLLLAPSLKAISKFIGIEESALTELHTEETSAVAD